MVQVGTWHCGKNVRIAEADTKVAKKPFRYWGHREIEIFLDAAKEDRLYALFVLAVTTGLRQGELFALRWSDLNVVSNTLSITRAASELRGRVSIGEPKTQKSKRCIDLPKFTITAF